MKMIKIKRNSLFLIAVGMAFSVSAQRINDLFLKIPDRAAPLFDRNIRMEMLEYFKAGQTDSLKNKLGGSSFVQMLDSINELIKIRIGNNAEMQLKLFKEKNTVPFIGVIETVFEPRKSSSICFYDTLWNRLPLKFNLPQGTSWLDKSKLENAELDRSWVEHSLANSFTSLGFDANRDLIVVENNNLQYLSEEDRKVVQPFVIDKPLLFRFEQGGWIEQP